MIIAHLYFIQYSGDAYGGVFMDGAGQLDGSRLSFNKGDLTLTLVREPRSLVGLVRVRA
jgi:hypothetical protein